MSLPPRHVHVTCKDEQTANILFIIIRVNTRVYALWNVVDDNLFHRPRNKVCICLSARVFTAQWLPNVFCTLLWVIKSRGLFLYTPLWFLMASSFRSDCPRKTNFPAGHTIEYYYGIKRFITIPTKILKY